MLNAIDDDSVSVRCRKMNSGYGKPLQFLRLLSLSIDE